MNNKLKTLKDLNGKLILKENPNEEWIIKRELKAEAIKRYKENFDMALYAQNQGDNETKQFCLGICSEIMDFFNLTEDDLK